MAGWSQVSQARHLITSRLSVHPRFLPSNALLLAAPSPQDSAQFECVVSNEVGEARRLYHVTIHGELGQDTEEEAGIWAAPPFPGLSPPVKT